MTELQTAPEPLPITPETLEKLRRFRCENPRMTRETSPDDGPHIAHRVVWRFERGGKTYGSAVRVDLFIRRPLPDGSYTTARATAKELEDQEAFALRTLEVQMVQTAKELVRDALARG